LLYKGRYSNQSIHHYNECKNKGDFIGMKKSSERQKYEKVIERVAEEDSLLRMWPLTGGLSAEMTVLEVVDPAGRMRRMIVRQPSPAVLQQNPDAAKNEFNLLQALQPMGLATPVPIDLDQASDPPYLVLEYIEGKPDFAPFNKPRYIYQLAAQLVKIHSIQRTKIELPFLAEIDSEIKDRIGVRPVQTNQAMEEGRIRDTLEAAWPFAGRNADVLLHGDYWPGNILWRGDELIAVIDWEDACWGDPLYDLAIARLDLLWIYGLDVMTAFTEYYQSSMPLDYSSLPYWDLYAALRFIRLAGSTLREWAEFFHPYGRRDITTKTIQTYYQFFIHQATERLPDG
jgi:aminoglycoside phosphotransferase (APT) family kinase protein